MAIRTLDQLKNQFGSSIIPTGKSGAVYPDPYEGTTDFEDLIDTLASTQRSLLIAYTNTVRLTSIPVTSWSDTSFYNDFSHTIYNNSGSNIAFTVSRPIPNEKVIVTINNIGAITDLFRINDDT